MSNPLLSVDDALSSDELVRRGLPMELLFAASALDRLIWTQMLRNGNDFAYPAVLAKPIAARTASGYAGTGFAFERWCAAKDIDDVTEVDQHVRTRLVTAWLIGRSPTHSPGTLDSDRRGLRWWAKQHRLPDPVSDDAAAVRGMGPGRGRAKALDTAGYNAVLRALDAGGILPYGSLGEQQCQAWHLREKAAVTITVACSLRAASELPHLDDDDIIDVDTTGIHLKLPKSKMKDLPQDLTLFYRGDNACPVMALFAWLSFCAEHDIPRHGRLLPGINRQRFLQEAMIAQPSHTWEANQWKRIMNHVGLDPRATLHGLRGVMPTEAAAAGWDELRIRNLGRWVKLDTAAGYVGGEQPNLGLLDEAC